MAKHSRRCWALKYIFQLIVLSLYLHACTLVSCTDKLLGLLTCSLNTRHPPGFHVKTKPWSVRKLVVILCAHYNNNHAVDVYQWKMREMVRRLAGDVLVAWFTVMMRWLRWWVRFPTSQRHSSSCSATIARQVELSTTSPLSPAETGTVAAITSVQSSLAKGRIAV